MVVRLPPPSCFSSVDRESSFHCHTCTLLHAHRHQEDIEMSNATHDSPAQRDARNRGLAGQTALGILELRTTATYQSRSSSTAQEYGQAKATTSLVLVAAVRWMSWFSRLASRAAAEGSERT